MNNLYPKPRDVFDGLQEIRQTRRSSARIHFKSGVLAVAAVASIAVTTSGGLENVYSIGPANDVVIIQKAGSESAASEADRSFFVTSVLPATSSLEIPLVLAQIEVAKLYMEAAFTGTTVDLAAAIERAEADAEERKRDIVRTLESRPPSPVDVSLDAAIAILDGKPVSDDARRLLAARRSRPQRRHKTKA